MRHLRKILFSICSIGFLVLSDISVAKADDFLNYSIPRPGDIVLIMPNEDSDHTDTITPKNIDLEETHQNESVSAENNSSDSTPAVSDEFKVVAYYPSWKYNQLDKVSFDIVTHVIYAFALPQKDGTLKPLDNAKGAQELIAKAHDADRKVLLAVGGWSDGGNVLEPIFKEATATPEKRQKLAEEIVSMCNTYGFDGIDIDWEYPRISDGTWKQYEAFMVLLSDMLHSQDKLFTAAVLSGIHPSGSVSPTAMAQTDIVLQNLDWVNIMAYDGDYGAGHSPYDTAVASANYWKNTRHLPAEKVVLGVPFYARPTGMSYENIILTNPEAAYQDSVILNGTKIWHNSITTIQQKTQYAIEHIGGIMIWEITQDTSDETKSLLHAIGNIIP